MADEVLNAMDALAKSGVAVKLEEGPSEDVDALGRPDHPFVPAGAPMARCAQCGQPQGDHPKAVHEDLVTVLYLLLRDELPIGKLMKAIEACDAMAEKGVDERNYSLGELEALARRLAARLSP